MMVRLVAVLVGRGPCGLELALLPFGILSFAAIFQRIVY